MANPDSAYRRILLGKAALKIKIRALESMERPSERLLLHLVRQTDCHPKVRLLAADLLKKRQQKKTIDEILKSESHRLKE